MIECLELHHVTGRKLDPDFAEVRCRNCHRKIELQRDVANLTSNGERKGKTLQSDEIMRLRLLGLAEGHVSTAAALRRWAEQITTGEDADEKEHQ
jgi:hypothetical protein